MNTDRSAPGDPSHALQPAAPANAAGRKMLADISGALDALAQRLVQQQQAAAGVASLAVRAEAIAASARRLAYGTGGDDAEAAFAAELDAFSVDLRQSIELAAKDALTGKAVAAALLEHAATIDDLARMVDTLEVPAIKARLRPLAVTLAEMPATQRAGETRKAELLALAERADLASATAAALASARPSERREILLDVAHVAATLAADVAKAAVAFGQDADLAARAAEAMTGRARRGASGATDMIGAVVRSVGTDAPVPARGMAWTLGSG
jgi:hypothetical protein